MGADINHSGAEKLAILPEDERRKIIGKLSDGQAEELRWDWSFWARPKQLAPAGDWSTWAIRAGRGFGKTRTGTGWVHKRAMAEPKRWIALIGRTPADVRDYMIEGPGGLLRNTKPDERPEYKPSIRRVQWPNGSWATIYSGDEPDQLRGFSGDTAWIDELAKFRYPRECWDSLQFGMREPSLDQPRTLITTTPRPLKILQSIEAMDSTVVVKGSSYENRANLDPKWFDETILAYEGTRFGRQEIHAEILGDVPGAFWHRANLDEFRRPKGDVPEMSRIVVGVDPAATSSENANETGIIVVGLGEMDVSQHGFVLDDWSLKGAPDDWAKAAVAAYHLHDADRIVAEKNQGGEMVEAVLRSVEPNLPIELVTATRGKSIRAEPVSALYEQGRIHHVGSFEALEDQMVSFTASGSLLRGDGDSPDRVDALVWAFTELFPGMVRASRDPSKPAVTRQNTSYNRIRRHRGR